MPSVMFVCLGNICRSPAAEAILKHMLASDPELKDVKIESSGLGDWHKGRLPDERMREAAELRGYSLLSRAQTFKPEHLKNFDLVLAVDHEVLSALHRHASELELKSKLHLITSWSDTYKDEEIPDPYYGGMAGFDLVLDMLEESCQGIVNYLKSQAK